MLHKELLFTGFYSITGEKIYLGDKIKRFISGDISTSFVIQFDDLANEFFMIPTGKDAKNLPFRKYPLKGNLNTEYSKFHIVGNIIIPENPEIGKQVKIIVNNKGESFPFGSFAEVLEINEWEISAKSEIDGEIKTFSFGEFMVQRK